MQVAEKWIENVAEEIEGSMHYSAVTSFELEDTLVLVHDQAEMYLLGDSLLSEVYLLVLSKERILSKFFNNHAISLDLGKV